LSGELMWSDIQKPCKFETVIPGGGLTTSKLVKLICPAG